MPRAHGPATERKERFTLFTHLREKGGNGGWGRREMEGGWRQEICFCFGELACSAARPSEIRNATLRRRLSSPRMPDEDSRRRGQSLADWSRSMATAVGQPYLSRFAVSCAVTLAQATTSPTAPRLKPTSATRRPNMP